MLENIINIQYCYYYLIGQTPISLLLYSHIPTAIISILFGSFVFIKDRTKTGFALFIVCLSFSIWCIFDIVSWFSFIGSDITMFVWSLLDVVSLIMFFFLYYFLYTFITKKNLPVWQSVIGLIVLLPTTIFTFLGANLISYDSNNCAAIENNHITNYLFFSLAIFIVASVVLCIFEYIKNRKIIKNKKEILLVGIGSIFFMVFFFSALLLVSLLAEGDASLYVYNYEIYGLFGMPVLLIFLGYLVVKFKAFDIKLIGSQALVWALIILIGSEFFFVTSVTNQILVAITLVLSAIVGLIIVRSVKKEIAQKEELELANQNQQLLIRFITHQVKGFFTKSKMVFASMIEGDFGEVPETVKAIVKEGLESDNRAVEMVQEVLNASSLRNGTMTYNFEDVNFSVFVKEIAESFRAAAVQKGLQYEVNIPNPEILVKIDKTQMTQVIKNLIDNSIKYTISGCVKVDLKADKNNVFMDVCDSGVGLSEKDKSVLFKEGGRGEESLKYNINSTGYGLFIVKKIVEGHGGKIWAESVGRGHGSKFYVEVPIKK